MTRLLPQPLMSVTLFATWLLLNNAISAGHVLFAAVLAVALPLATHRYWPEYPRTVRIGRLLRFSVTVLFDILVANVRIAVLILGPVSRLRPHFVVIPVELQHPFAITLLASVISLTPGTVSANLSGDRRSLLVHDLNVKDPAQTVAHIKQRYERPLKEIFE